LNIADLFTVAQGSGISIPILGEEITISGGQITFTDLYQTDVPRTLTVQHLDTKVKWGIHAINVSVAADIPYDKRETRLALSLSVPRQAAPGGGVGERAEGRLDARALNLAQLAPFLQSRFLLQGTSGLVDVKTAFEYRAVKEEDTLTLKDLQVNAKGTVVSGSAIIKGILTKPAGFVASLKTTPFQLETVLNSVPEDFVRTHKLEFLKTSDIGGPVRLASLRVVGNPDQPRPVTVQGEVELLGVHALVGPKHDPITEAQGLLRIDGDHVGIERLTGKYGQAEVTAGRGEILHVMEEPQLYLAAKGKLSAQELAAVVARYAPRSVLPDGVNGLSDLTGEANASVVLDGPLARMESIRLDWTVQALGISFRDARLPLAFNGLQGTVHSIPHGIAFEDLTGSAGALGLIADGQITFPVNQSTVYDLKLSGRADAPELWKILAGRIPDTIAVAGTAEFKTTVSGPGDELAAVGSVDLTHTGIVSTTNLGKPQGVPSVMTFTMRLVDGGQRLRLDRALMEIPPFNLFMRGNVALSGTRHFRVGLRVPSVAFRAFPEGLLASNIVPTAGSIQAELMADGTLDNWWNAGLRGRASIKNLSFKMERLEHAVEDLNMDIAFRDNRIDLEKGSVRIEDSQINVTASIRGWRGVPSVDVAFESPGMDLDLLIPKGERSPIRTALEAITKGTKLAGSATIHNATYKGIEFDEVRAKLSGGDNKPIVDSITGRLPVGTVNGQLTLSLIPDKPIGLETTLIVNNVPVEPFMHAFGVKDSPVTGGLSLKASLRGETGTFSTLNGEVRVIVRRGYFQKYSATAKVIGILNLPTLLSGKVDFSNRGMPFDCLSVVSSVKNGVAKIERYIVDSPIMKITAAGDYDIVHNNTTMVMAVSPLGSYEEFLKELPVFGKLFIGDRHELVTAFYEVKGPLEDPKVRLLPLKSVATGVGTLALIPLDIMKNVFLFPKELLHPSKSPPSPCDDF
jgi:hypothetical protein